MFLARGMHGSIAEKKTCPEIFFKYLTAGDFSLAECYLLSTPCLSWKQVLIGDPLYRPFRAAGK